MTAFPWRYISSMGGCPPLLKGLNAARRQQCPPLAMTIANIISLLKPGKDSLDPGSYRPISLLQMDITFLAKVLSLQLNNVIITIIHSDQSGHNPQKSTSINLCRLILNLHLMRIIWGIGLCYCWMPMRPLTV